jgi:hypothetical protein
LEKREKGVCRESVKHFFRNARHLDLRNRKTLGGQIGGDGGNGVAFSIVGTSTYYAGGGAGVINGSVPGSGTAGLGGGGTGGTSTVFSPLQNGVPGTGGGGGGGYATPTKNGGSGGPGIVVISYQG